MSVYPECLRKSWTRCSLRIEKCIRRRISRMYICSSMRYRTSPVGIYLSFAYSSLIALMCTLREVMPNCSQGKYQPHCAAGRLIMRCYLSVLRSTAALWVLMRIVTWRATEPKGMPPWRTICMAVLSRKWYSRPTNQPN